MDFSRGCFLLSRSIDESDIFQNEKWLKVFIWCLIQANYKGKNVSVRTGRSKTFVRVERGQFVFGRNNSAEKLNMSPSTVRNIMKKLSDLKKIDIKQDSHHSIVTVCNYNEYQDIKNYKGQAVNTQRTGNEQDENVFNTEDNSTVVTLKGQAKDRQRTGKGQATKLNNTGHFTGFQNKKKIKNPKKRTQPIKKEIKKNKYNRRVFDENSIEFRLSIFLQNYILRNNPDFKNINIQNCAKDFDLLLRVDKRELEEVKEVIRWCQSDPFWHINILSAAKLRKHYDRLKMEKNKKKIPKNKNVEEYKTMHQIAAEDEAKNNVIEINDYIAEDLDIDGELNKYH
jgi:DNA-binding Lrp family transcriptional regulator